MWEWRLRKSQRRSELDGQQQCHEWVCHVWWCASSPAVGSAGHVNCHVSASSSALVTICAVLVECSGAGGVARG